MLEMINPRLVVNKLLPKLEPQGDAIVVREVIGGGNELKSLDPFLLLNDFSVSPPAGFPDHPHRGFEIVTYVIQGGVTHQDFTGHKNTFHAGDLQWLAAGRGIIHSEMPAKEGINRALQLWINLSSCHKMIEPKAKEFERDQIAEAEKDGVQVRVLAGESMGVCSPVYTKTPIMYLDFTLKPMAQLQQPIPEAWNAFVYIIEGEGVFGVCNSSPVPPHHVLILGPGDGLCVWNNSSHPLRFVLIGGQPLNEPVVHYGPFVMNTQAQIEQTIQDYRHRKNGFEMGKNWASS